MSEQQRVTLPGQRLRAEREAQGLSTEEVARQLNLTVSYLNALEADDYERLPEATFIRGYIRNYARLLGLPSEDLAHTFDEVMAEESGDGQEDWQREVVRPRPKRSGRLGFLVAGVLSLAAVIYWLMGGFGEPAAPVDEPAAPSVEAPASSGPADAESAAEDMAAETAAPGEPEAAEAGPIAREQEETAATPDRLLVSFSDSCWVEVGNEAGDTLYAGQKQADERLSLEAEGPFRIKFGNAAAVSLITVNGEVVPMPSSAPGNVVHLKVP